MFNLKMRLKDMNVELLLLSAKRQIFKGSMEPLTDKKDRYYFWNPRR